jgi:hypothetical protein
VIERSGSLDFCFNHSPPASAFHALYSPLKYAPFTLPRQILLTDIGNGKCRVIEIEELSDDFSDSVIGGTLHFKDGSDPIPPRNNRRIVPAQEAPYLIQVHAEVGGSQIPNQMPRQGGLLDPCGAEDISLADIEAVGAKTKQHAERNLPGADRLYS